MAYDRFLIAPFQSGLDKSASKWLLPEDAYTRLNNAYVYRGKLVKRFGSRYMGGESLKSRFRFSLVSLGAGVGITTNAGNATGSLLTLISTLDIGIGQMFSIGSQTFTVASLGTAGVPATLLTSGGGTGTLFTTGASKGVFTFTGVDSVLTAIYFYPSKPVMGLCNYQTGAINNHPAYGFDTQLPYFYTGSGWERVVGATTDPVWKGSNSQFFWASNWQGPTSTTTYLFVTNFNAAIGAPAASDDDMYYWSGTDWAIFRPTFTVAGSYVKTARILLPFKDRFVLLNTIERIGASNVAFPNRCRYSAPGSPIDAAGYNWLEVDEANYRGAGWTDAATEEAIIGAGFIRDRLIVYFERSTWELAFTGNSARPFIWQKLNAELGAQSTFSTVLFDKELLAVGNVGIHACNGVNVGRIDSKIYADIFNIRTANDGIRRVAGIRDYRAESVYWSWPNDAQASYSNTYPNKLLVYNYENDTWAYNDDVVTAWGYFEQDTGDIWADDNQAWEEDETTWATGINYSVNKEIIAGNQQGFVFIADKDIPTNAHVLQVTDAQKVGNDLVLTIIDHTLAIGDYIYVDLNGLTILPSTGVYKIKSITSANIVTIDATTLAVTGTYTGGALASRVSRIDVLSKQWNPYIGKASNFTISKIDFCVERTDSGRLTIDYSPNSGISADDQIVSMIDASGSTGMALGSNILETSAYPLINFESYQERLWHPVYFQTQGNCIQIRMYYSDADMLAPEIWSQPFTLEGLVLYTKSMSGRLE